MADRTRKPTQTSNFGVGRREGHDASAFYARFTTPLLSDDTTVEPQVEVDRIWVGDASDMDTHGKIADNSVALVVTSPPYFAGKAYEEDLSADGVPSTYLEYLDLLEAVFAECVRKLEPGGRIAVNVANLGRKPYRSLSADIIGIYERLGLLLRGEIIWRKADSPGGSCAWGTFQRPGNPVLRDTTERILVASKGRFDRAIPAVERASQGLPAQGSMRADEFLDATSDVWDIAPESARRVGHPAPFPVELPRRLIELYTYSGDLILDPFMGAGSSALAAVATGRHYVGFDLDPDYVKLAEARVADENATGGTAELANAEALVPPKADRSSPRPHSLAEAVATGAKARDIAASALARAGFTDISPKAKVSGVELSFSATATDGQTMLFEVVGGFTRVRPGMQRTDAVWKALAKALMVASLAEGHRVVLLTTHLPKDRSPAAKALAGALQTGSAHAVVDLFADDAPETLHLLANANS